MSTTADTKTFGALIRVERKSQKLAQEQLAGLTGVGVRFVRELKAGKASCQLGRALQVAQTLGLVISVSTRRESRYLDVHFKDTRAGILAQDTGGTLTFAFDTDYLQSGGPNAISFSMPLREEQYSDQVVRPVFPGLLPDEHYRQSLSSRLLHRLLYGPMLIDCGSISPVVSVSRQANDGESVLGPNSTTGVTSMPSTWLGGPYPLFLHRHRQNCFQHPLQVWRWLTR